MRVRSLQALALLTLCLWPASSAVPATAAAAAIPAAARPNIVLILTDDQDLASLSVMPKTQALIGAPGLTFGNYIVPLSLCCPARSSIFTGEYAHNHDVRTNNWPAGGFHKFFTLGREDETVAVALHRAGYRTALFGKYLNGYPDAKDPTHVPPGWDEWASPAAGDAYGQFHYTLNENGRLVPYGGAAADYMTDVLAAKGVEFIRRAGGGAQPFFLALTVYSPHKPATPAPRHAKLFRGAKVPRTPAFDEVDVSDKPVRIRRLADLKSGQIASIDALYRRRLQALRAVDDLVEGVVAALRASGQLDRTYLFFTSDNGFHLGQHRLQPGKKTPYEEDIHVPLLVRGPGVPAGARSDALAVNVDLAPTFAELAGATLVAPADGRSLVPFLATGQSASPWRRMVLLEQFPDEPSGNAGGVLEPPDPGDASGPVPTHVGLRTASYTYVEYGTGERELYDLRRDPYEVESLHARADPQLLARLSDLLHALATCAGDGCRELEAKTPPPLSALRR
jgi:arylsulfatase A-like enzyme